MPGFLCQLLKIWFFPLTIKIIWMTGFALPVSCSFPLPSTPCPVGPFWDWVLCQRWGPVSPHRVLVLSRHECYPMLMAERVHRHQLPFPTAFFFNTKCVSSFSWGKTEAIQSRQCRLCKFLSRHTDPDPRASSHSQGGGLSCLWSFPLCTPRHAHANMHLLYKNGTPL